jgi:hypothetical protein
LGNYRITNSEFIASCDAGFIYLGSSVIKSSVELKGGTNKW